MKTIYVANDGMQFDNPSECVEHEKQNGLNDVRMWNQEFRPLTIEDDNWFEDVYYISAPNKRARDSINDLCDANGCILPFYGETENAFCVFFDDDDCEWRDLESKISYYQNLYNKMKS